jgi:hypothetical protein
MMIFLILIAFFFCAYLFYVKFISVFISETSEIIEDTVIEKNIEYSPYFVYIPDSPFNHNVASREIFSLKTKQGHFISVSFQEYNKYFINSPILLQKKEIYYIERSGFLWKKSNLSKRVFLSIQE